MVKKKFGLKKKKHTGQFLCCFICFIAWVKKAVSPTDMTILINVISDNRWSVCQNNHNMIFLMVIASKEFRQFCFLDIV